MRIIIVEDEAVIARRLTRLLRQIDARIDEIEYAENFSAASAAVAAHADSIVFLDLNLHGNDGFDLLRRGLAHGWRTIVVSAHAERAIEAFELGVVDFVPKPFSVERLRLALERATAAKPTERLRFLVALQGAGTILVALDQIVAIHGADDYSELETTAGQRLLHRKSLNALAAELAEPFVRVHRSHIVNLQFASALTRSESGGWHLHIKHGGAVKVSRRVLETLRKKLV